jgi:hypothetical protein
VLLVVDVIFSCAPSRSRSLFDFLLCRY